MDRVDTPFSVTVRRRGRPNGIIPRLFVMVRENQKKRYIHFNHKDDFRPKKDFSTSHQESLAKYENMEN